MQRFFLVFCAILFSTLSALLFTSSYANALSVDADYEAYHTTDNLVLHNEYGTGEAVDVTNNYLSLIEDQDNNNRSMTVINDFKAKFTQARETGAWSAVQITETRGGEKNRRIELIFTTQQAYLNWTDSNYAADRKVCMISEDENGNRGNIYRVGLYQLDDGTIKAGITPNDNNNGIKALSYWDGCDLSNDSFYGEVDLPNQSYWYDVKNFYISGNVNYNYPDNYQGDEVRSIGIKKVTPQFKYEIKENLDFSMLYMRNVPELESYGETQKVFEWTYTV